MSDNNVTVGPSGLTLLAIVFVTLKLCGVIGWSWWWVLSPLWIPLAILAAVLVVVGVVMLVTCLWTGIWR